MKTRHRKRNKLGSAKILIPVGSAVSRKLITEALHIFSVFKTPLIVLLTVIEIPSRTATLETEPYRVQISSAEKKLNDLSEWLTAQGLRVQVKVAVARNVSEGIIEETDSDGYTAVFMMKRKTKKGWRGLFTRSVSQKVVRGANCFVMTAPLE
jgi:nucleotide-binding universal stress UspA family protein